MIATVFFAVSLTISGPAGTALAEQGKGNGKPKEEFPKSGVLSRSVTTGYDSRNVEMPWTKKGASTGLDEVAPISGSVSKISNKQWRMKVFNNTEDTYSVSLKVVQVTASGSYLKSDSFSYTLKPKQSEERTVSSTEATADASLELLSWKKLTPPNSPKGSVELSSQTGETPTE